MIRKSRILAAALALVTFGSQVGILVCKSPCLAKRTDAAAPSPASAPADSDHCTELNSPSSGFEEMKMKRSLPRMFGAVVLLAAVPLGARAEDLDKLIQQLLERNPALAAARRAVDSKQSLVTPARTLPEPSVSFETMGNL